MTAFEITFLGHQGWLFAAGGSRLLVDPLLTPSFGHRGALGAVYPPRVFSFEALPPIDAVFLTHEHEDHFDVPSLARIDRAIPILLSSRSSRSAAALLADMGFTVRRVSAGAAATIGDLELHTFSPDLANDDGTDEWDVLPFLVRDRRGHGGFFTTVDAESHERLEGAVRALVERPPVWCYTNNVADFSFGEGGKVVSAQPLDTAAFARLRLDEHAGLRFRWGDPPAVVVGGGGFAFTGDRAWMNAHVFRADSAAACAAMAAVVPHVPFLPVAPGQTLSMRDGALASAVADTPYLRAAPRAEWPARAYLGEAPLLDRYSPFTAARELDDEELRELGRELDGFAAHLYSRHIFRELLSLDARELEGRRPTFSLVALCDEDGGGYAYEYDPASCAFVRARGTDPVEDYVGGLECWASDLLAAFRGEIAPSAIVFGRCRSWNALPTRCRVGWQELWVYCHPLRRPAAYARLYRRLLDEAGAPAICVRRGRCAVQVHDRI